MGMQKQAKPTPLLWCRKKGQPVPWSWTGMAATATRRRRWNNTGKLEARPGQAVTVCSWRRVCPGPVPTQPLADGLRVGEPASESLACSGSHCPSAPSDQALALALAATGRHWLLRSIMPLALTSTGTLRLAQPQAHSRSMAGPGRLHVSRRRRPRAGGILVVLY